MTEKETTAMKAVLYLAERNTRVRMGGTWVENIHDYENCEKISFDEAIKIVADLLYGEGDVNNE